MMRLDQALFLGAYTSRSKAYAQAVHQSGLAPGQALIFGDASRDQPQNVCHDDKTASADGLFYPDLNETLTETCRRTEWNVEYLALDDVNHPEIARQVKLIQPDFVIYSGYGGQLVKPALLELGIPFIHMHSGWLPEYCGSTTLYYSLLQENSCAVTAFILNSNIDDGRIIARRRYAPPPPGVNVDHLYDGAIRADLLVCVLRDVISGGTFPDLPIEGNRREFYVIHPVLKHIALINHQK